MKGFDLEAEDRQSYASWTEPGLALAGLLALAFFAHTATRKEVPADYAARLERRDTVVVVKEKAAAPAKRGPVAVFDGRVEIEGTILFPKGSASLTDSGAKLLGELVPVLTDFLGKDGELLMVSGFTDDLGIKTSEFPSNWELSALRATNVVRALVRTGFPEQRIFAAAFGENRPQVENLDESARSMNRRVELIRVPAGGGR